MSLGQWLPAVLYVLFSVTAGSAGERVTVRGTVVDAVGKSVSDVDVGEFWSANGIPRDADGTPWKNYADLEQKLAAGGWKELHQQVGVMEPHWGSQSARTDAEGRFSLEVGNIPTALLAINRARTEGAVILVAPDQPEISRPIALTKLVDVRGRMRCIGVWKKPEWSNVYVAIQPDEERRPLDYFRLADCSSLGADFAFKLPAGNYHLEVYCTGPEAQIKEGVELAIAGQSAIDLGTLELKRENFFLESRIAEWKAKGDRGDFKQHFGKAPPKWFIADARGVDKSVQLSDFKGKWVVLEFWNLSCVVCLKHQLPEWADFYRTRAQQRDAFEILGVCVDVDESLASMADVEKGLAPIVAHTWQGKELPFPLLLDAGLRTWQSFGLEAMADTLLVDPEGNLTNIVGHDEVRAFLTKQLDRKQ